VHVGGKTRRYNSRYSAKTPIIARHIIRRYYINLKTCLGVETLRPRFDVDQWYFPEVMSEARDYPESTDRGGVFR